MLFFTCGRKVGNNRYCLYKIAIVYCYRLSGGAKGRTEKSPNIFLNTNKLLHALLGETYTINPHVPAFQLAAILQEFPLAQQADDDSGENTSEEKKAALKEVF